MKSLIMILIAAAAMLLAGCGGAGIDGTPPRTFENGEAMVAQALKGVSEITAEELRAKIENEEMILVIDVREPDDYWEECIDGAFNVPRGILEFSIGNERFWDDEGMYVPEKSEEIIVYSGKGKRGVLAAETLIMLGYENVKSLYGGWAVWKFGPDALEAVEAAEESGGCGG